MNSNDTNNLGVTPNPVTPPPQGSVDPVSPTPTAPVAPAPTAPVTPVAQETPAPVRSGSVPPSTPEGKDDKKKLFVIIGVVLLLAIVVVLIVLSNTSNDDKNISNSTNDNSSNSSGESSNNDDLDVEEDNKDSDDNGTSTNNDNKDKKTIYLYNVKSEYGDQLDAYFATRKDSDTFKYELLSTYECKSECLMNVTSDRDDDGNRMQAIVIKDGKVFYEYDVNSKKYNEFSIDKTIEIDDYTFAYNDKFIIGYSTNELSATQNDEFSTAIFTKEKVSGVTTYVEYYYYTSRDLLKESLSIFDKKYDDYQIYQFYKGSSKIAENKVDKTSLLLNVTYNENYLVVTSSLNESFIVSNNGKVQVNTSKYNYVIKDGKLAVINGKNGIDLYDADKKIKTYEADDPRVVTQGYGAYIKDHKLIIIDLFSGEELHVFDNISDNLVMKDYKYARSFFYDSYFDQLNVFLEDTKKEHENNRAYGTNYSYNIKTKEVKVNTKASAFAS